METKDEGVDEPEVPNSQSRKIDFDEAYCFLSSGNAIPRAWTSGFLRSLWHTAANSKEWELAASIQRELLCRHPYNVESYERLLLNLNELGNKVEAREVRQKLSEIYQSKADRYAQIDGGERMREVFERMTEGEDVNISDFSIQELKILKALARKHEMGDIMLDCIRVTTQRARETYVSHLVTLATAAEDHGFFMEARATRLKLGDLLREGESTQENNAAIERLSRRIESTPRVQGIRLATRADLMFQVDSFRAFIGGFIEMVSSQQNGMAKHLRAIPLENAARIQARFAEHRAQLESVVTSKRRDFWRRLHRLERQIEKGGPIDIINAAAVERCMSEEIG